MSKLSECEKGYRRWITPEGVRVNPIELNAIQESLVQVWAADDRLWTTQEAVEFNLRVFARNILKARH